MTVSCSACRGESEEGARYCSNCGTPFEAAVEMTRTSVTPVPSSPASGPAAAIPGGGRASRAGARSAVADAPRFLPGQVIAERYRVVALAGRGGMGEVYRADDLTLGQPVALKFLPEALAAEPTRLDAFLGEVRVARQVSHPNVCRVYDIGFDSGQPFLTMEFVDGEDLATLLRRIGRFPHDRALEIARELCAGLAAAHDKGVLHRDLKPANVMIDGRGKVRIADFGLAGLADAIGADRFHGGTPAYMAPEVLDGGESSSRSDIYALGLILYEVFTGRPAFEGATLNDIARSRRETTPRSLVTLVPDMDPAIERAILRCLEREPESRPGSAIGVAAALPGGDPLAAALAAGETPSPDLVAASGSRGELRPAAGAALVATALLAMLAAGFVTRESRFHRVLPMEKPPQVLQDRAREIARDLGYPATPADQARCFEIAWDATGYARESDPRGARLAALRRGDIPALRFRYRTSPRPLEPRNPFGRVYPDDPAPLVPGMTQVRLDMLGRLLEFRAVPAERTGATAGAPEPARETDWAQVFRHAGLELADAVAVEPDWTPPVYADTRSAWSVTRASDRETTLRFEAATLGGRPVYLRVVGPWTKAFDPEGAEQDATARAAGLLGVVILASVIAGALVFGRRNYLSGRADRRAALRLALYVFGLNFLHLAAYAHHQADPKAEFGQLVVGAGYSAFWAGLVWGLYLSLEPFVRRRWPDRIISWTRLLAGSWRDPLVGRELLAGCAAGGLLTLAMGLLQLAGPALGADKRVIGFPDLDMLEGVPRVITNTLLVQVSAILNGFLALFIPILLSLVLRPMKAAVAVSFLLGATLVALQSPPIQVGAIAGVVFIGALFGVLLRFGLLALVTCLFCHMTLGSAPLTLESSAWYFPNSLVVYLMLAAIAAFGFHTSRAGQPLFRGAGSWQE